MAKMDEKVEEELITRLISGDKDAFLALYNHYQVPLYTFIIKFVKVPDYADDILQDSFLKIWEIRARINPALSFQAYLYKLSRNLVYKYLKDVATNPSLLQENMYHFKVADGDAELSLQWKEYEVLIANAIGHLPTKRQQVFKLCRQEGKSYEEVSEILQISRNTVKEHMVLAMRSIGAYIKKRSDGPISMIIMLFVMK